MVIGLLARRLPHRHRRAGGRPIPPFPRARRRRDRDAPRPAFARSSTRTGLRGPFPNPRGAAMNSRVTPPRPTKRRSATTTLSNPDAPRTWPVAWAAGALITARSRSSGGSPSSFASFAVGMFVIGAKQATDFSGPGESGRALTILDEGFKQPAGESVLIQSDSLKAGDPAFEAAIRAVLGSSRRAGRGDERPLPARRPETRVRSRPTAARRWSSSRSAATPTWQSRRSIRSSSASPRRRRRIRSSSSARSATQAWTRSSRGPSWTT